MVFTTPAPAPQVERPAPDSPDPSRTVAKKALSLPCRLEPDGTYTVASGTEVGKIYRVQLYDNGGSHCDCVGTRECSHIWAARALQDPAIRRRLRILAAPKPRGRKAATR